MIQAPWGVFIAMLFVPPIQNGLLNPRGVFFFFLKAYQIHRLRSSNAETPDPMPDAYPVIDFGLKDVKRCDGIAKQTITSQSNQNKT